MYDVISGIFIPYPKGMEKIPLVQGKDSIYPRKSQKGEESVIGECSEAIYSVEFRRRDPIIAFEFPGQKVMTQRRGMTSLPIDEFRLLRTPINPSVHVADIIECSNGRNVGVIIGNIGEPNNHLIRIESGSMAVRIKTDGDEIELPDKSQIIVGKNLPITEKDGNLTLSLEKEGGEVEWFRIINLNGRLFFINSSKQAKPEILIGKGSLIDEEWQDREAQRGGYEKAQEKNHHEGKRGTGERPKIDRRDIAYWVND